MNKRLDRAIARLGFLMDYTGHPENLPFDTPALLFLFEMT